MKKSSLLVFGLVSTSILGGVVAHADTGTSSTGKVSISEVSPVDPGNPDPEDPDVDIIDPEIPDPGESRFKILYASNLEFGEVEATSREQIVKAQTLDVTTSISEETVKRVPWVTTYDMRNSAERTAWELEASATPLEDGEGHVLRGAAITLSNLNYATGSERAPEVKTGRITLGDAPQTLASASIFSGEDTQDTGVGSWSLALGHRINEDMHTDGVELVIPSNIVINDGVEYTSTITWNLAITP
ncbi:WxL domain-containing protein [Enterococcus casseliflavus]|nr:WxL domain-containing protein [Enterococcus casseliflavus]